MKLFLGCADEDVFRCSWYVGPQPRGEDPFWMWGELFSCRASEMEQKQQQKAARSSVGFASPLHEVSVSVFHMLATMMFVAFNNRFSSPWTETSEPVKQNKFFFPYLLSCFVIKRKLIYFYLWLNKTFHKFYPYIGIIIIIGDYHFISLYSSTLDFFQCLIFLLHAFNLTTFYPICLLLYALPVDDLICLWEGRVNWWKIIQIIKG